MAEAEKLEKVMLLTDSYRIVGEMRLGPDGTLWDFKHRAGDDFIMVHNAQCFALADGRRIIDATQGEFNRRSIVAVFRAQDIAFLRKEPS